MNALVHMIHSATKGGVTGTVGGCLLLVGEDLTTLRWFSGP